RREDTNRESQLPNGRRHSRDYRTGFASVSLGCYAATRGPESSPPGLWRGCTRLQPALRREGKGVVQLSCVLPNSEASGSGQALLCYALATNLRWDVADAVLSGVRHMRLTSTSLLQPLRFSAQESCGSRYHH